MQTVTGINGGNPFPVLYTGLELTRYRYNFGPKFYSTTTNGAGAPGLPQMIPTFNPPVNTSASLSRRLSRTTGQTARSTQPTCRRSIPTVTTIFTADTCHAGSPGAAGDLCGWNLRPGSANAPTPQDNGPDGCEATGGYIQFAPTPATAREWRSASCNIDALSDLRELSEQGDSATDNLIWNRYSALRHRHQSRRSRQRRLQYR